VVGAWGLGRGAQVSGFRVQISWSRVQGSGSRVQGPGFRVQDSGFRDYRRVRASRFGFSLLLGALTPGRAKREQLQ